MDQSQCLMISARSIDAIGKRLHEAHTQCLSSTIMQTHQINEVGKLFWCRKDSTGRERVPVPTNATQSFDLVWRREEVEPPAIESWSAVTTRARTAPQFPLQDKKTHSGMKSLYIYKLVCLFRCHPKLVDTPSTRNKRFSFTFIFRSHR